MRKSSARDEQALRIYLRGGLRTRIQLEGELPVELEDPLDQLFRRVALLRDVPESSQMPPQLSHVS